MFWIIHFAFVREVENVNTDDLVFLFLLEKLFFDFLLFLQKQVMLERGSMFNLQFILFLLKFSFKDVSEGLGRLALKLSD